MTNATILVVDDEQPVRNTVRAYLEKEGYTVHTAADGPTALRAARAFRPDVVILDINQERRRISLGIKQLQENPWDDLAERYSAGTECKGKIVRLLDHGTIVEIENEVEGFVPAQQLAIPEIVSSLQHFHVDEELPLRIIKMDPENRKIVLSVQDYFDDHPDELDAYIEAHPQRELTEEELAANEASKDEELEKELAAENVDEA